MVFTAVDQRRVQYSNLTTNDAVVALRINYLSAFENILQVLPDTKDVIVVVGTSPIEKFWKEAIGKEVANRIKLSWTDELSFEALLQQASALPPHTSIFWELMIVDAAGVVTILRRLARHLPARRVDGVIDVALAVVRADECSHRIGVARRYRLCGSVRNDRDQDPRAARPKLL